MQSAQTVDSVMDFSYTFDDGPNNQPTSFLLGPNFMASKLYQLSPPEDLTLAVLLERPHPKFCDAVTNEVSVTKEKYGSVDRVYIVSDQDKLLNEDFQRWMIQNYPTKEVKLISGSDHMAMFSKPKELCCCLQETADEYN